MAAPEKGSRRSGDSTLLFPIQDTKGDNHDIYLESLHHFRFLTFTCLIYFLFSTNPDPSSHSLDLRGFVQEAVIMRDFRHAHVLGLVGLAERATGVPWVILPYMDHGDLHSWVKDATQVGGSAGMCLLTLCLCVVCPCAR